MIDNTFHKRNFFHPSISASLAIKLSAFHLVTSSNSALITSPKFQIEIFWLIFLTPGLFIASHNSSISTIVHKILPLWHDFLCFKCLCFYLKWMIVFWLKKLNQVLDGMVSCDSKWIDFFSLFFNMKWLDGNKYKKNCRKIYRIEFTETFVRLHC